MDSQDVHFHTTHVLGTVGTIKAAAIFSMKHSQATCPSFGEAEAQGTVQPKPSTPDGWQAAWKRAWLGADWQCEPFTVK